MVGFEEFHELEKVPTEFISVDQARAAPGVDGGVVPSWHVRAGRAVPGGGDVGVRAEEDAEDFAILGEGFP